MSRQNRGMPSAALDPFIADAAKALAVRHLRQVLLWTLRLMPMRRLAAQRHRTPWQLLRDLGDASPWREVIDEYAGESGRFQERHYNEFVTFLPYVQRFLYGEGRKGRGAQGRDADAPMRVFRREDIAHVRVVAQPGDTPVTLEVIHVDLYFFYDVDVVLLNVELGANDLTLAQAQEQLYRFGRGYPAGWDGSGHALHTMASVEWLDAAGAVLASSDSQQRELFMAHVAEHRAPRTAAHWAHLLKPLVADQSDEPGELRYRQIEYYRMPLMAYLALDDPRALSRTDFIRLGLVTGAGGSDNGSLVDDSSPSAIEEAASSLPYPPIYLCATPRKLDPLYDEVKVRIADMNTYLDADSLRRQANTVVRLTVVTILGLIGTVTTGSLGMNLLAEADAPRSMKFVYFMVVFALTTLLTFYTMGKSKGLSDFLDALSNERLTVWQKTKALAAVWRRNRD